MDGRRVRRFRRLIKEHSIEENAEFCHECLLSFEEVRRIEFYTDGDGSVYAECDRKHKEPVERVRV